MATSQPAGGHLPELEWTPWLEAHPLPHLVFALDDGRVLAANAAASRRYGWPPEQLLAISRSELVHPEEHERMHAFVAALPASAEVQPQPVWRERTREGAELLSDVRGTGVRYLGRAARLITVIDAAPRARLVADAEIARELLAVAGQTARVGGWALDLVSGAVVQSPFVRELHQIAPGQTLDLARAVSFYPGPAAQAIRAAVDACSCDGVPFDLELPFVGARGTHYRVRAVGRAVRDAGGRIVRLEGAFQDVSVMAELRQRFERMAEAAPVAIFQTDEQGRCTYANRAWRELFQLSPGAGAGHGWLARVHPEDRERVRASATLAAEDAESEWRMMRADGSERLVHAQARALPPDPAGGRAGQVSVITDLTSVRALEAAERARAVAEEAGRRQAEFMSRVSHELRTPLNAILGFGQLLESLGAGPGTPDSAREWLGHILGAGRHMLALVDDLLALQKLEQGRVTLQPHRFVLSGLLARAVAMLRVEAESAGVVFELAAPEGLVIESDERHLLQVLLNLLSNAIKYGRRSDGGSPSVVRVLASAAGERVLVAVHDRGRGLTPEQLARLFRPFERLGRENGSAPGSGLGLVITRQLARLLGGELRVSSVEGQGTSATLHLPRTVTGGAAGTAGETAGPSDVI